MNSFVELIKKTLTDHWEQPALSDFNGKQLLYADVAKEMAKFHIGMEIAGIVPGDRIAIYGRNSSNWAIAFFSILTYGCVLVPVQSEFQREQVHNIINHSGARFMFIGKSTAEDLDFHQMPRLIGTMDLTELRIRDTRSEHLLTLDEQMNQLFQSRFPQEFSVSEMTFRHEASTEELAIINYTSGTTGFSKGVMIPYRALLSNYEFTLVNFAPHVPSGSPLLSTLPMAHCYGMACEIIFGFLHGCHITFLTRQPSPSLIMAAAEQIHPAILLAVPLVIEKIVRKYILPEVDKHRGRYLLQQPMLKERTSEHIVTWIKEVFGGNIYEIMTGGAPLNQEIESFLMEVGFPITSGYGTTETGPMITYSDWKDHTLGSCGSVVPNMEMRVLSEDPENVGGEVIARGANVMLGYYRDEAATREVLDADGWFHTGDLGTVSADGKLFLRGRIKNMLLGSNGQNIYPEEIEDKLNSMPMVSESLVVQHGERLVALVYPDLEEMESIPLTQEEVAIIMEQNREQVNALLPSYCKISEIHLHPEEFQKTAKKSIKRYLYKLG